jgi:hypothetical protein
MSELIESVVNFFIEQVLENGSYFPFLWIMLMMTTIVYVAHKDHSVAKDFNFYDALMSDNRASLEKMAALLGYITLTWWFVDACAKGKAGVAEAGMFGGILVAARLGSKALDGRNLNATTSRGSDTGPSPKPD